MIKIIRIVLIRYLNQPYQINKLHLSVISITLCEYIVLLHTHIMEVKEKLVISIIHFQEKKKQLN